MAFFRYTELMVNNLDTDDIGNIISRAKNGDKEAFSHLYKSYFEPLYHYIYFKIRDRGDTEDMVQEVFLKAYTSFDRYTYSKKSPLAYFYTIARNTIIDHYRKQKISRVDEDLILSIPDEENNPEENSVKNEEALELREKIALLPETEQEVIIFKFINELETKEIAEILDKKEEAVRQLQSRGLKKLRSIYNKHE